MKHFIYTLVLLSISLGAKAQLGTKVKEFNRGRLQIIGSNYGHPYTMFDKHNGKSFEETIDSIRSRIKLEKGKPNDFIFKSYELIYTYSQLPMPSDNGMPYDAISALASWAKNNAFVMLVGLDGKGNDLSIHGRDSCKKNVLRAFDALQGEITNTALAQK